ncbi:Serpentine Receptor, class Z [Caenorhabditis elegans]|uniref:Serpentine Receptor, class Z n=1 Tax=Caenorhabditis elegans TaxID=6239 RepID=O45856_CAEEL|nr:Serpentine Receptor, class Z [Caenorhabditis elegans]CAB05288.3 Serpentine Receptor, class Z [Caenorhabditis elegans]|eukprot:NP_502763.3 Uncharacterized protein CELE_T27E7.5 [Caenorhabditis elegans]
MHIILSQTIMRKSWSEPCLVYFFFFYADLRGPNYTTAECILLFPVAIITGIWLVYICILTIFAQVYQTLLACHIFELSSKLGKDEPQLTELQIGRKQYEMKSTIRTLYICCIVRDLVLTPVIVIWSAMNVSRSISLEALDSIKDQFTLIRVFRLITFDSIVLFVPAAVLYYLSQRRNLNNKEHAKNPLQVHIFHQAMIMTSIKAITVALCTIMSLIDQNLSWITTATLMDQILVVVSVQISTTRCFKQRLIAYQESKKQEVVLPRLAPISYQQPLKY